MILNPSLNVFGLEGAQEIRERSVDQLINLKLQSKMPDNVFRAILDAIHGDIKKEKK